MSRSKLLKHQGSSWVWLVILFRLVLAPLIFISVWPATLATFLIDLVDGEIFKKLGWPRADYALWDKALDSYWYVFVLAYIVAHNLSGKNVFLALFLYRALGQLIFFLTKKETFFVFFPNLFEVLFLFYLLSLILPVTVDYLAWPYSLLVFLPLTLIIVLVEYSLHLKKVSFHNFLFPKHASAWPVKQKA